MIKTELPVQVEFKEYGGEVGRLARDVQTALVGRGLVDEAIKFNAQVNYTKKKRLDDLDTAIRVISFFRKIDYTEEAVERKLDIVERFKKKDEDKLQAHLEETYQRFLSSSMTKVVRRNGTGRRQVEALALWEKFYRTFRGLNGSLTNGLDGKMSFSASLPYSLSTAIEVPWGETSEEIAKMLGITGDGESLEGFINGQNLRIIRQPLSQTSDRKLHILTRYEGVKANVTPHWQGEHTPKFLLIIPTASLITA